MKRRRFLIGTLAVCTLATLLGVARANDRFQIDPAKAKEEIQAAADKYTNTLVSKKFVALTDSLTEDWLGTNVVGDVSTRNELVSFWSTTLGEAAELKATQKVVDVYVEGNTVKALLKTSGTATLTNAEGVSLKAVLDNVVLTTYVKTDNGWKAKAARDLWEHVTVDDKLYSLTQSAAEAEAQKAIQTRYDNLIKAMKAGDQAAVANWFPEGFTSTDADGQTATREEFMAFLNGLVQNAKFEELTCQVERVRLSAGKATVLCTFRGKVDAPGDDGARHKLTLLLSSQNVHTKDKGASGPDAWKPTSFKTLYQESTTDGKPDPIKVRMNP